MHSAIDIGQVFLDEAKSKNEGLTPMKVIKLVYIAHGWMLAINNEPLINEDVEVWKYGPVLPELYNKVKHYRSDDITEKISDFTKDNLSPEAKEVIEKTFELYGDYTGWELSNIAHKSGSPWDKSKQDRRSIIPNYIIKKYYEKLGELPEEEA